MDNETLKRAVASVNCNLIKKHASAALYKKAGIVADSILPNLGSGILAPILPGIGHAAQLAGMGHGAFSDKPTSEDIRKIKENGTALSLIPGVGDSRALRKKRYYARDTKEGTTNIAGEYLGQGTSTLAAVLAGAGIGAGVGGAIGDGGPLYSGSGYFPSAALGAAYGALGGLGVSGVAHIASLIAAAAVKRRTLAEQKAHDNSMSLKSWLVPGVAEYNKWKRIGVIKGIEDDEEEKNKKA